MQHEKNTICELGAGPKVCCPAYRRGFMELVDRVDKVQVVFEGQAKHKR